MLKWIVGVAVVALAAPALAQPMMCGTGIINPGDSMARVLELCGRPEAARHWVQVIPGGDDDEGWMDAARIPMAEWVYADNDDPDTFPQKLLFKNGIVQQITGD
ncbi:MAG: DUF2845 domain-containing protein [bacterium]